MLPVLVLNSWLMRPNERQPKRGPKVSQCGQIGGARVTTDTVTLAAHICGSSWSAQASDGAPGATCGHQASAPAESDPGLSHVLGQEQAL